MQCLGHALALSCYFNNCNKVFEFELELLCMGVWYHPIFHNNNQFDVYCPVYYTVY